jgi:MipA family protein
MVKSVSMNQFAKSGLQICACIGLSLCAVSVRAQSDVESDWRSDARLPLWELGVAVGALSTPAYRGSDAQRQYALPLPYFIYRGDRLKADRNGVRTWLWRGQEASLELSLAGGVPVRDVPAREGMDNLPPVLEIGPVLRLPLQARHVPGRYRSSTDVQWELQLPVRQAFRLGQSEVVRDVGWVSTPGVVARGGFSLTKQPMRWTAAANAYFGEARYHAFYYDVQSSEVRADRPEYHATGGYGGWALSGGLQTEFGRQNLGVFVRMSGIENSAFANSPLVKQNRNYSVGLFWAWVFTTSDERK